MIPRDVAELLDELWLITRRLDGPDRHDARVCIDDLRTALTSAFDPERYVRQHDERTERGQPLSAAASRAPQDYFDTAVQNARAQAQEANAERDRSIARGRFDRSKGRFPTPTEMAEAQKRVWSGMAAPTLECTRCTDGGDVQLEGVYQHPECLQCGEREHLRVRGNGRP